MTDQPETEEQPYAWFVAYSYPAGHGCIEIKTTHPVNDFSWVMKFAELVESRHGLAPGSVVITNFQLLRGPA